MQIEVYKGIKIFHDANKDEFYTNIVINKTRGGKTEYIRGGRLQKLRDDIDKYLNTASKKPIVQKGWLKSRHEESWQQVEIIAFNCISNDIIIKDKTGASRPLKVSGRYSDDVIAISCKENDAIITNLNKKMAEIRKIEKEVACSGGKLIPLKPEHFQ